MVAGEYEDEYIKEDGKWKFRKIHWRLIFSTPYEDGWVKTPIMPVPADFSPIDGFKPKPSTFVKPIHPAISSLITTKIRLLESKTVLPRLHISIYVHNREIKI